MTKNKGINTDYFLTQINWHLGNHALKLVKPDSTRGIPCEEGTFLLMDIFGEIVLKNVDLAEFTDGFNLLKSGELRGFEDFVAHVFDCLLIKIDYDVESSDCETCDDLRNTAAVRIGALMRGVNNKLV